MPITCMACFRVNKSKCKRSLSLSLSLCLWILWHGDVYGKSWLFWSTIARILRMECLHVSGLGNYCLWNTEEYNTHCDTQRLLCLSKIAWSIKLQAHTVWPPEDLHLSTMSTLWKHIATAWILQCHQKNLSLFPLCFSPTLCLSLSALCVKSENEEQQGMNGLGEMHSYSGMPGMHSSTKNDSCLLVPHNPCQKNAEAGEILQSQENTHRRCNWLLSVRNDGLMQVWPGEYRAV